jgi:hypothetical protein
MAVRAVLSADNIVTARNVVSRQHGGFQAFQFGAMALALTPH